MKYSLLATCFLLSMISCHRKVLPSEPNAALSNEMRAEPLGPKTSSSSLCSDTGYKTNTARSDAIRRINLELKHAESSGKGPLELSYFCAFPNSFNEMVELFGYGDVEGPGPLYEQAWEEQLIQTFAKLKSIPPGPYYDKFFSLCKGGSWQADNIGECFFIEERYTSDVENLCEEFAKQDESDIHSVFTFQFDGPHPESPAVKTEFNRVHNLLLNQNIKLAKIAQEAYADLIRANSHDH